MFEEGRNVAIRKLLFLIIDVLPFKKQTNPVCLKGTDLKTKGDAVGQEVTPGSPACLEGETGLLGRVTPCGHFLSPTEWSKPDQADSGRSDC